MEPCTTQQTNGKDDSATHNLWIGGAFLSQDPSVEVIEIDAFGRRQAWTNGVQLPHQVGLRYCAPDFGRLHRTNKSRRPQQDLCVTISPNTFDAWYNKSRAEGQGSLHERKRMGWLIHFHRPGAFAAV